jgi:hypothetical protein
MISVTATALRLEMLDACGKKAALTAERAATLCRLLAVADVAVISGGDWRQSDRQVASRLPVAARDRQAEAVITAAANKYLRGPQTTGSYCGAPQLVREEEYYFKSPRQSSV